MTTSPTPATRTKVLLVDDHDLIRKGLRHAFERDRQFEVVGEAATAAEGVRQAGALQPDVVIMDLRLPDGSGLEATRALRKSSASMGIVVLTMYAGDDQLFGALEAGASAFVPKTAPADEVVAAARHAASSPSAFTAADLAEAMKRRLAPSGPQLSPREGQVLRLLADGMSVAGIAKQLFVSESTAKTHISKLYEKLGAANRAQALMTALRLGLLEAPDQPGSRSRARGNRGSGASRAPAHSGGPARAGPAPPSEDRRGQPSSRGVSAGSGTEPPEPGEDDLQTAAAVPDLRSPAGRIRDRVPSAAVPAGCRPTRPSGGRGAVVSSGPPPASVLDVGSGGSPSRSRNGHRSPGGTPTDPADNAHVPV